MRCGLAFVSLSLGLLLLWQAPSETQASDHYVALVDINGAIDPVNARFLSRTLDKAESEGAQMVVIRLDTPGGLLSSTRDMVEAILEARVPVAVYVAPQGAHAASAGTFITAAANLAVMAPGTNIGAASPVASGGQDIPATLAKKINEDTRAFIRSIAAARGRNSQALEETVTKARSYSAGEAVEMQVVDFIASDMLDMLNRLDGGTVDTVAGPRVLRTRGADVRDFKRTLLENFLGVVSNPDLAFVLLSIGGLGILIEFLTPGLLGPGIVGAIALALAFIGIGQLPVNWVGVGLVLFSMVLFFMEAQEPGWGIFGIGGLVCFVVGGFLLFGGYFSSPDIDEPGFGVNVWIIVGFGSALGSIILLFLSLARSTGSGSATAYLTPAQEAVLGKSGTATSDLTPSGTVRVADAEWTATADRGDLIRSGEEVRVTGVYGVVVMVSRYDREVQFQPLSWRARIWRVLRRRIRPYFRRQTRI